MRPILALVSPTGRGGKRPRRLSLAPEEIHAFSETLAGAVSISHVFDPAISKLQARGEKAAAKNLIQAKKIYDLERLESRRLAVGPGRVESRRQARRVQR